MSDFVRRCWVPVWDLPAGTSTVQRVLPHPVCLVVVADSYATFVGPTTGLSTRELSGRGWAFGTMLQPAAGALLLRGPVSALTDKGSSSSACSTRNGSKRTRWPFSIATVQFPTNATGATLEPSHAAE